MTRRRQRLILLGAAILTAAVLALLWRPIREEMRIERIRLRALADKEQLAQSGHAIKAYLQRIGRDQPESPVLFEDWLALAGLSWPRRSHQPGQTGLDFDESFFRPDSDDFRDPRELAALIRVDDPVVLRILIRLESQDRSFRDRIDAAMREEVPGFGPAPAWRPFEAAARRWLNGKPPQRAAAAMALVDLAEGSSQQLLSSKLAEESDPDLRALYTSCLAGLGHRELLPVARADFYARLANGLALLRAKDLRFADERIKDHEGWGLHDMAANLLRVGDIHLLERAFELADHPETDLMAFAIAQAVPAFPIWEIFSVEPNKPVPFSDEVRPTPAGAWWAKHGSRLRYDEAMRAFVLAAARE